MNWLFFFSWSCCQPNYSLLHLLSSLFLSPPEVLHNLEGDQLQEFSIMATETSASDHASTIDEVCSYFNFLSFKSLCIWSWTSFYRTICVTVCSILSWSSLYIFTQWISINRFCWYFFFETCYTHGFIFIKKFMDIEKSKKKKKKVCSVLSLHFFTFFFINNHNLLVRIFLS